MRSLPGHGAFAAAIVVAVLMAGGVSGCASSATEAGLHDANSTEFAEGLSAHGVLFAAVLLSTADISAAVAEGLVTPDEVDAAIEAIADGTLDEWRKRAESERH